MDIDFDNNNSDESGRTRVSKAVLDTLSMIAARGVGGVEDIDGLLVTGSMMGGFVGGAIGLAQGDAFEAATGAVLGSGTAAAVITAARQFSKRRELFDVHDPNLPTVSLRLTVRDGYDLNELVGSVQEQVRAFVRTRTSMELADVNVVISKVVSP